MNYLALSQRLRQEVGAAGTGPSAVTNQSGESKRIVDWIATADEDIQRKHNEWRFMRSGFTVNTVAGTASYAYGACTDSGTSLAITAFRDWVRDSLKLYLLSAGVAGETELDYLDYQSWYEIYNTGSQTNQRPRHWTIGNDMALKLGPTPDDIYRLSGEYQKAVTTLAANGDSPAYPSEYHLLAVYRGMMKYGRFTGASEVYQDGKNEYTRMLGEMERTQLPDFLTAGPLV